MTSDELMQNLVALRLQTNEGRFWSIAPSLLPLLETVKSYDTTVSPFTSLEDYPEAIGILFEKPIYAIDPSFPDSILMVVHVPGRLCYLDNENRVSWMWSN